jgi:hypothetical protein
MSVGLREEKKANQTSLLKISEQIHPSHHALFERSIGGRDHLIPVQQLIGNDGKAVHICLVVVGFLHVNLRGLWQGAGSEYIERV